MPPSSDTPLDNMTLSDLRTAAKDLGVAPHDLYRELSSAARHTS